MIRLPLIIFTGSSSGVYTKDKPPKSVYALIRLWLIFALRLIFLPLSNLTLFNASFMSFGMIEYPERELMQDKSNAFKPRTPFICGLPVTLLTSRLTLNWLSARLPWMFEIFNLSLFKVTVPFETLSLLFGATPRIFATKLTLSNSIGSSLPLYLATTFTKIFPISFCKSLFLGVKSLRFNFGILILASTKLFLTEAFALNADSPINELTSAEAFCPSKFKMPFVFLSSIPWTANLLPSNFIWPFVKKFLLNAKSSISLTAP